MLVESLNIPLRLLNKIRQADIFYMNQHKSIGETNLRIKSVAMNVQQKDRFVTL